MKKFRIFLTNDDGFDARGFKHLITLIKNLGFEEYVVAPKKDVSGSSHALTLRKGIKIRKVRNNYWRIDGTPVDCVLISLHRLLSFTPDIMVAGINRGYNLGEDTLYSGTVAAVKEGFVSGLPAVAISIGNRREETHWDTAVHFSREILKYAFEEVKKGEKFLWNVNIPNLPKEKIKGIRWTSLGSRHYLNPVEEIIPEREYRIGGKLKLIHESGNDVDAILQGFVSITPLSFYETDKSELRKRIR